MDGREAIALHERGRLRHAAGRGPDTGASEGGEGSRGGGDPQEERPPAGTEAEERRKMNTRRLSRSVGWILGSWVALVALAPEASAQENRRITVTGEADVRVVPDEVVLTLGVETDDLDLSAAKAENDARMSRVIAVAEVAGLPDNLIRTDYLGIEPRYRFDGSDRIFLGYWVQKSVSLTLRDIDAFEDLLSAVLEAGANYVHGIDFRTTELRSHRDRARSLALEAAREKAEMMAGELGHEVGATVLIREDRSGWWSSYGGWWRGGRGAYMSQNVVQNAPMGGAMGEGATAPGQISVTANVSVTFELE